MPSVVVVTQDAGGQTLGIGSAFVVREGLVATNLHVIKDAARA